MGTSMSDSKTTLQAKSLQRSRLGESQPKRHQSLKRITFKGVTESSRVLSQIRLSQKQSPKKVAQPRKKDSKEEQENEYTAVFLINDKRPQTLEDNEEKNNQEQLQKQPKMQEAPKPSNKNEDNYFLFASKSQASKKISEKNQTSNQFNQQSQLKLPLSSLVKENVEMSLVSFSENPSSQKTNQKTSSILDVSDKKVIKEILNSLKQEKQQHQKLTIKNSGASKKLQKSYFNYGLTHVELLNKKGFSQKDQEKVKDEMKKVKDEKTQPLKTSSKYKEIINRESKKLQQKPQPIGPTYTEYYQLYPKPTKSQCLNEEANTNNAKEANPSQKYLYLNPNDSYFRRKKSSNFSSSSKTRSQKRLNLIYF